jgi:hypothetical protein
VDPDRLYSIDDIVLTESEGVYTRQSICFQFLNQTTISQYNVHVVWTDVPDLRGASHTMIDDMDMVVIADQGVWWSDNGPHPFELVIGIQAKSYVLVIIFP